MRVVAAMAVFVSIPMPTPAAEAYRQVMASGVTPELLQRYPGPRR